MTLTEFLLARIAEDDFEARQGGRWDGGMRIKWVDVGGISDSLVIGTDRVLAECEAKRQIVHRHLGPHDCPGNPVHVYYRQSLGCPTVCDLAAVYADHPDYREEWKP